LKFALSPDHRSIAFIASGDGPQRLWLRALDKTEARPLAGTAGADFPFWSPDSRSIGFFAEGKLKRVDVAGGPPQALVNAAPFRGGAWNSDGTILFYSGCGRASGPHCGEGRRSCSGDDLAPQQTSIDFRKFLPGGRHFVFYNSGSPIPPGLCGFAGWRRAQTARIGG